MRALTTGIVLALFLTAVALAPPAAAQKPAQATKQAPAQAPNPAQAQAQDLIPRRVLFGNPDRSQVQISPDGKSISFMAPRDGVMNVWVAPATDPGAARPVTNDRKRGIPFYFWAYDSRHVLYGQDQGGNENYNVYSVAIEKPDQAKNLTPNE